MFYVLSVLVGEKTRTTVLARSVAVDGRGFRTSVSLRCKEQHHLLNSHVSHSQYGTMNYQWL